MIDGNDVVRTCRREAHLEHVVRADPGVQRDPPPAEAMGIDQRMHFAGKLGLRQHIDDEIAFPGTVAFGFPVLDRAAPADAKMLANRRDPFRACTLDRDQAPAVGMMTRNGRDLDRLAAQRVRHIHVLSIDDRDAVAEMTDVIDDAGAQPRRAPMKNSILPSPPVIDDGNTWMSVHPSDAANAGDVVADFLVHHRVADDAALGMLSLSFELRLDQCQQMHRRRRQRQRNRQHGFQ